MYVKKEEEYIRRNIAGANSFQAKGKRKRHNAYANLHQCTTCNGHHNSARSSSHGESKTDLTRALRHRHRHERV